MNRASTSAAAAATQGLHRCAIAFCANTAVAEGVCAVHLSGTAADSSAQMMPTAMSPPRYVEADYDRYYRHGSHHAMQARGPMPKKSRLADERYVPYAVAKSYTPPTRNISPMTGRGKHVPTSAVATEFIHQQTNHGSLPMSSDYTQQMSRAYSDDRSESSALENDKSTNDGDSEANLRRERNRIAARKSRQRKLDRISSLEEEKKRLEQHRDLLVEEINSLEKRDGSKGEEQQQEVVKVTPNNSDRECRQMQQLRLRIIKKVEDAYNSGDMTSIMAHFRDDSIVSGPQNASVHLQGRDAMLMDYLCTSYLYSDIHMEHVKIDNGGPRSQHFRVHWVFHGTVQRAGMSMNKEFLDLIESVRGKRVRIEGVSNFSFSGDKIVYVHRTADQAKFLSALVSLAKSG